MSTPSPTPQPSSPAARYLDLCEELAYLTDDGPGLTEAEHEAHAAELADLRYLRREAMVAASLRLMPFPCP